MPPAAITGTLALTRIILRAVGIAQIAAAVAAGFAALRDDEIEAERFEALRFGRAGGAAAHHDAELFEALRFFP